MAVAREDPSTSVTSTSVETALDLPSTGSATINGVELPAGTNVADRYWITDAAVDNAAEVWEALVTEYPLSGLFPVLVDPMPSINGQVWLRAEEEFPPLEIAEVRGADVLELLRQLWDDADVPSSLRGGLPDEFPQLAEAASNTDVGVVAAEQRGSAYLALAKVDNPGDILAVIGWWSNGITTLQAAAITGSWYDRFGALPFMIGLSTLEMTSGRVPLDDRNRLLLAGEIYAFTADLQLGESVPVESIVDSLDEPTRYFWWD
ncbi:MAG: DUF4253 domain-containing protein [Acidimicrobiales bacterium]